MQDEAVAFGNFVTIWKKQPDGTWKFVLDLGIKNARPETVAPDWQLPSNFGKNLWKAKSRVDTAAESAGVLDLEREFSKSSSMKGALDAYKNYLAEDVRLYRQGKFPVLGRDAALAALASSSGTLTWNPTKADVARSGDLAYDYGVYELREATQAGPTEGGNYLRIWRRDRDGKWKVVLDLLSPIPRQNR